MKKKKRKFPPYQVFCCAEDEFWIETFRRFAAQTLAGFQEPKSPDLFAEIIKSDAYIFFLDWSSYQSIREKLDERYGNEKIKPLIYLIGDLPFYSPNNLSDWIGIFARESKEEALRKVNVARSRKRTSAAVYASYRCSFRTSKSALTTISCDSNLPTCS